MLDDNIIKLPESEPEEYVIVTLKLVKPLNTIYSYFGELLDSEEDLMEATFKRQPEWDENDEDYFMIWEMTEQTEEKAQIIEIRKNKDGD